MWLLCLLACVAIAQTAESPLSSEHALQEVSPDVAQRVALLAQQEQETTAAAARWWAAARAKTVAELRHRYEREDEKNAGRGSHDADSHESAAKSRSGAPDDAESRDGDVDHDDVRECPGPQPGFRSRNDENAQPLALVMSIADSVGGCDLFWVDFDGKETPMGAAHGGIRLNTYAGHAWRLRASASEGGHVLHETHARADANTSADAKTDTGADPAVFTLRVEPCHTVSLARSRAALVREAKQLAPFHGAFDTAAVEAACPELADPDGGWLNDAVSPGYHALCVRRVASSAAVEDGTELAPGVLEVAAYVDGLLGARPRSTLVRGRRSSSSSSSGDRARSTARVTMQRMRRVVEALLGMPLGKHAKHTDAARAASASEYGPQRWRFFGTDGRPIDASPGDDAAAALLGPGHAAGRIVLVYVGGQFIHPGVRLGFEREVNAAGHAVKLVTLSLRPLIFSISGFLTVAECDHIITKAKPDMAKSLVSHMDKDVGKPDEEFRTSTNTFLSSAGDTRLQAIDRRVANMTRLPLNHQEFAQVLRYQKGQLYGAHHDYWPADSYTQPDIVAMTKGGWKNRLLTVFWYMSDVALGGETNFPDAEGFPAIESDDVAHDCRRGLRVRPERGKVIAFYSLLPDGTGDISSLHGACPPKVGLKWAANKWLWNEDAGFYRNDDAPETTESREEL